MNTGSPSFRGEETRFVARAAGPRLLECLKCARRFKTATEFQDHLDTIDCFRSVSQFGSILRRALRS